MAPTTMSTTTPRGVQSQGRPEGGRVRREACAVATTPHDSNDNFDDSADKAAKPGATDMADKATRDCTRRVRVAVARKSAMAT